MSVEHVVYIVVGVFTKDKPTMKNIRDIVYGSEDPDIFQEPHMNITVIDDCMCGKYTVIGKILSSHSRYDSSNYENYSLS